jgi:serine phosphatase RsbU (regulator of sigma subunit)
VIDLDLLHHRIRVALAGHPAPLIRGRSGAVEACRAYGHFGVVGIGLNRDATEVPWLPFTPGSLLVLATDGVFDAGVGRGELFGSDRLMSAIESADEPCEVMEVVCREVFRHLDGHPLEDDLTVLVISRSPVRSPALVQDL